jgi:hypothetical protein
MSEQTEILIQTLIQRHGTPDMLRWHLEVSDLLSSLQFPEDFGRVQRRLSQAGRLFGHETFTQEGTLFSHSPRFSASGFLRLWLINKVTIQLSKQEPSVASDFVHSVFYKGDMHEQIATLQSFDLCTDGPASSNLFISIATDALRTNNVFVFSALAHCNRFPSFCFTEDQCGQMILKTLFMNLDVMQIYDLEKMLTPKIRTQIKAYEQELKLFGPNMPPKKGLLTLEQLYS